MKPILPLLYQIVTGERKSIPLIYLVTKTLERAYKVELSNTMKEYVPLWMPLIKEIIDYQDDSLTLANTQNKNTTDSYFFRAKKWAARIVTRFFHIHASFTYNKENEEYAKYWINTYAAGFLASIAAAVVKPNFPKTVFSIFKSFSFVAARNPELALPYS